MKKILTMILVLAMAFSSLALLASCDDEAECVHADLDKDHKCDECGEDYTAECVEHVDEDKNGTCDYCEAAVEVECEHVDEDKDAKCDKCGVDVECAACEDADHDQKCDVCGKDVACEDHVDADKNGECDYCGAEVEVPCDTHVDADRNQKCDNCGATVDCAHIDSNRDGKCEFCGADVECKDCVDADKNGKCDVCDKVVPCETCQDYTQDGKCDVCGSTLDSKRGIDATLDAYKNSVPTKIVTEAYVEFFDIYEIKPEPAYSMKHSAWLVTGEVDGKLASVMRTEVQNVKYVSEGATEIIQSPFKNSTKVVEFLSGFGTRENNGSWKSDGVNFAPTAKKITLNVTKDNVTQVRYYESLYNNTLIFKVPVENVDEVFGGAVVSDEDVMVTIVNNGAQVTSVKIECQLFSDNEYAIQKQVITAEYSYEIQEIDIAY